MTTDPNIETARALLYRHGLPEGVIDGVLCLHAQELAAVIRAHPGPIPWLPSLPKGDGDGFWWDTRDRDAAADLIDPTPAAPAGLGVSATPSHTDQAAELERLRTENERMRHELEVMYGGAFDSLDTPPPADRAAVLAEVLPDWEAVYEPGNVSDYLIGYANDQDAATGMAEAWMRSQAEVTGRLEWVSEERLATGRYDRWFELIERHDDGIDTGPGIIVRRRMADEAPQPEPDDPTQCSGEEGFCPEHGFHRHTLKQPGTADAKPADQAAVLREAADRGAVSATLWAAAEHHTVAEWICCDPINPDHPLCAQGGAALQMLQALLVDDPEAWKPAPLLNEVMRRLPTADQAETERLRAERDSLGREAERLRTDWTAMRDRAERAKADRDWWRDRAYAVQARAERADRAAVLREAADVAERLMDERYGPDCSYGVGGRDVARELRHHADEAQPARCDVKFVGGGRCAKPADRAAVYREAADRLAAMYSDDDPAVENLRQWADDENEQAEAEGGCAHCGSSDHSWDECRAYTAAVADAQQEPPVHGESVAQPAGYQPDGRDTWADDCCGAEPTDKGWIGDCWCTLPPGHDGEHRCQPCTDRHGAPGWTDEPAVDAQDGAQH